MDTTAQAVLAILGVVQAAAQRRKALLARAPGVRGRRDRVDETQESEGGGEPRVHVRGEGEGQGREDEAGAQAHQMDEHSAADLETIGQEVPAWRTRARTRSCGNSGLLEDKGGGYISASIG